VASLSLSPAAAQPDTGVDTLRAAYHDLLDLFYRPLDHRALLNAAWSALQNDATVHGVAPPQGLPDLPDDPDQAFGVFANAYSQYVSSRSPSSPVQVAASAMADSLKEQHTHYLPPSLMQRFLSIVGGGQQSIGLGIKLGADPPGLITEVAPDSPAAKAGLQPGDVIVTADGKDLSRADIPSIAAALTGPAGSSVSLSIDRGDGVQPVEAMRGAYYFPPLESRMLPDGVGYLRLTDFVISGTNLPNGTELLADLDRRLDDLDAQGAQSLVLDLRNNGGGSVQTADEILGRFLPDSARSVRESDLRGHETFELAGGRVHPRQLRMTILINGGSASASEVVAAAMRDEQRAVLVGQRTAGAVASSVLLPLPDGGGLQLAVAATNAPVSGADLDEVGVTPDVFSSQSRALADYRSGRDPQLDAAVAALASAPPPPSIPVTPSPITADRLDALLESVLPPSSDLPRNDRFQTTNRWQRLDYLHPNELIDQNGGSPDPVALQQTMRTRGYQGSVMASYGSAPGNLPTLTVNADLYAAATGAQSAVSTNDLPFLLQPLDNSVSAGEQTSAYRGTWLAAGSTQVSWRRGRVVVTVTYSDVPGFERPDTLAAAVQVVDARAAQLTLP
jgi:carboxyl-terminal processing protease